MEISSKNFALDESLDLVMVSTDSDGLINIPNELLVKCQITNNYGKILINNISIQTTIDTISLKQTSISDNLDQLDIKNIDRYIFKQIADPAQINHNSYKYFFTYDLSIFEKGRRPSETDWAVFGSLYCFSCHVIPKSMNVFLPLAKFLRISEVNIKKLIRKTPEKIICSWGENIMKMCLSCKTIALGNDILVCPECGKTFPDYQTMKVNSQLGEL